MKIDDLIDRLAQATVEGHGAESAVDAWHEAGRPSRAQALAKAEIFRAINRQNGTNNPLPAWIRAAIGEQY